MIRVYLRHSSDSQDNASQRHAIDGWLAIHGAGVPVKWYQDDGISGDAKERPAYRKLLAEVRKGDTVVCFAVDRLSREGIVPTIQTVQQFTAAGVRLASVSEPWLDTDNPCWELILSVLSWVAQQEKKRIKGRQAAGIAAAKSQGRKWGGRPKGIMQIRTPEIDATVRQMKAAGTPVTTISRVTKISRQTIYIILRGD